MILNLILALQGNW